MKIAYDVKLMKPGCAIVQAALGGDSVACNAFDAQDWVTHLTDDMRVYEVNTDQLEVLVAKTEAARG